MNRCPWPTPGNKKGGQITDPAAVEYRGCRDGAFNFLIGQVMKATRGKANPQLVNAMLKKLMTAF